MTLDELLDQQPPDVRAEIEAITSDAGTWDADWEVLLAAGRRSAELRATLREYLALSSLDGRPERQKLREKLGALLK